MGFFSTELTDDIFMEMLHIPFKLRSVTIVDGHTVGDDKLHIPFKPTPSCPE